MPRHDPRKRESSTNAGSMLGHRLRRWPNIKPALAQRPGIYPAACERLFSSGLSFPQIPPQFCLLTPPRPAKILTLCYRLADTAPP